jgi:toxin FitB
MIEFLLDTNTISELQKKVPDANVANWFFSQPINQLYLSSFTIAEIEMGIHQQRDFEKAEKYQTWLETTVLVKFTNRILPFDTSAARVYGRWAGENRKNGTPLTVIDTQIAAIAYVHGLVVATRNTDDFKSLPIRLVNPWLEPKV